MLTLTSMMSEERCYEEVRKLRWPEKVHCPHCESIQVVKRGYHSNQTARQRYECQHCDKRFDDLTGTVFAGHHQPLSVWMLCLYLMGLNISNAQIAQELDLQVSDTYNMCTALRALVDKKKSTGFAGLSRM